MQKHPFNVSDVSKYENGKVKPDRARVLLFIFFFKQREKLQLQEANRLLTLFKHSPLEENEPSILFGDQLEKTTAEPIEEAKLEVFKDIEDIGSFSSNGECLNNVSSRLASCN